MKYKSEPMEFNSNHDHHQIYHPCAQSLQIVQNAVCSQLQKLHDLHSFVELSTRDHVDSPFKYRLSSRQDRHVSKFEHDIHVNVFPNLYRHLFYLYTICPRSLQSLLSKLPHLFDVFLKYESKKKYSHIDIDFQRMIHINYHKLNENDLPTCTACDHLS